MPRAEVRRVSLGSVRLDVRQIEHAARLYLSRVMRNDGSRMGISKARICAGGEVVLNELFTMKDRFSELH